MNFYVWFFIIEYNGADVGLINIRDIDERRESGESGIFIWDDSILHQGISVKAGLALYDFCFHDLCLDYLTAHIFNTNPPSIFYHRKFGFTLDESEDSSIIGPVNQLYILKKKEYKSLSEEYKYKIAKITPQNMV